MAYYLKRFFLLLAAAVLMAGLGLAIAFTRPEKTSAKTVSDEPGSRTNFPVVIHKPEQPKVLTSQTNYSGEIVSVSCSSCHTTTKPNPNLRDATELKQFHQGMTFKHGDLSCLSCHNQNNYDSLRLADSAPVDFPDVMQLCGQCHGPQLRDYRNGAHGGMNGFWDLTRGPRQRNNCTDCHDPHSPAYPAVMPVFQPAPAERGNAPAKPSSTRDKH